MKKQPKTYCLSQETYEKLKEMAENQHRSLSAVVEMSILKAYKEEHVQK